MENDIPQYSNDRYAKAAAYPSPNFPAVSQIGGILPTGRIPAVLDTSYVRTGLHFQLSKGQPPAMLYAAQNKRISIFMELETLHETLEKLPEFAKQFAKQFNVSKSKLQMMFDADWLPLISVVDLPAPLRYFDSRVEAVKALDEDDYPAAALAALLSPCILLTANHRDFHPFGIRSNNQGKNAIIATVRIDQSEQQLMVLAAVPAAPAFAIVGGTKWAADRIGPIAWLILGLFLAGAFVTYRRQTPQRQKRINETASEVGEFFLNAAAFAVNSLEEAQQELDGCIVRGLESPCVEANVIRTLAIAESSLSAQQLYEAMEGSMRLDVPELRKFLHDRKSSVFQQVRRGGFVVGRQYRITPPTKFGAQLGH